MGPRNPRSVPYDSAYFIMLEQLPLNINGKVDRGALPLPNQQRPLDEATYAPPTSPLEAQLVDLWAEVLAIEPIGIHDNFFELGGHSLSATQIVARISHRFQIDFPLRRFFEAPTIVALTIAITQIRAEMVDQVELEVLLTELEQSPGKQLA